MIKLKIRYHTDFHRFLSSTFGDIKEKPRKMARGFLQSFLEKYPLEFNENLNLAINS